MATSMSGRRSALKDAMTAGYKPFLSHALFRDGPHGLCVHCFSPRSRIRPSLHWDRFLRPPRTWPPPSIFQPTFPIAFPSYFSAGAISSPPPPSPPPPPPSPPLNNTSLPS